MTLLGHRLDRVNLCAVRAIATLLHAVLAHTRPPAHVLVFEHLIARHPAGKDGGGLLSCCPSALLLNEGRVFFFWAGCALRLVCSPHLLPASTSSSVATWWHTFTCRGTPLFPLAECPGVRHALSRTPARLV